MTLAAVAFAFVLGWAMSRFIRRQEPPVRPASKLEKQLALAQRDAAEAHAFAALEAANRISAENRLETAVCHSKQLELELNKVAAAYSLSQQALSEFRNGLVKREEGRA